MYVLVDKRIGTVFRVGDLIKEGEISYIGKYGVTASGKSYSCQSVGSYFSSTYKIEEIITNKKSEPKSRILYTRKTKGD